MGGGRLAGRQGVTAQAADDVLTVLAVTEDGVTYEVNGWTSNDIDIRHYRESREGDDHQQ